MCNDPVYNLLNEIIASMVNTPNSVSINRAELPDRIVYYVRTEPGEEGQIIGKNGSLGAAIRTVIKSAAQRHKFFKWVYLDVVDSRNEPF